jgi:hypothetical protein
VDLNLTEDNDNEKSTALRFKCNKVRGCYVGVPVLVLALKMNASH